MAKVFLLIDTTGKEEEVIYASRLQEDVDRFAGFMGRRFPQHKLRFEAGEEGEYNKAFMSALKQTFNFI